MSEETPIIIRIDILLGLKLVINLKELKLYWDYIELSLEIKETLSSGATVNVTQEEQFEKIIRVEYTLAESKEIMEKLNSPVL